MISMEKVRELDGHWTEVMELAEKYGFIIQAYGGTATLMTHENRIKALGEQEYTRTIKVMFGKEFLTKMESEETDG